MRRPRGPRQTAVSARARIASLGAALCLAGCLSPKQPELVQMSQAEALKELPRVSLTLRNYCLSPGNALTDFFVTNVRTRTDGSEGRQESDLDGDGVLNRSDFGGELGLSPQRVDSDLDGIRDLALSAVGFALSGRGRAIYDALRNRCTQPELDTDGDGLSDCEERLITATAFDRFDTDGDGIPDELELRFGLNPLDPTDASPSPGGDSLRNIQKVKYNLLVNQTARSGVERLYPVYEAIPAAEIPASVPQLAGTTCLTLKVAGMPAPINPAGALLLIHAIRQTESAPRLDRCCVQVSDPHPTESQVDLDWRSVGTGYPLQCPCPLNLIAEPAYRAYLPESTTASGAGSGGANSRQGAGR